MKPFDVSVTARRAYYFVRPLATRESPKIKAFREWLLSEADKTKGAAPY